MRPRSVGFLIFSFCLILAASCTKPVTEHPSNLLGTWTNQDPAYEGRYIEINKTDIIFGTGTGTGIPTFFLIEKVTGYKTGDFTEWTFHCKTQENVSTDIVLFFTQDEDGLYFELRNKRQVQWVKD